MPAFLFLVVFGDRFPVRGKIPSKASNPFAKNTAKSLPVPNLLTGYGDTAARGNTSR
jgi:hypothetical protein